MEYKKIFPKEEMQTLADWFQRHMDEMPEDLWLDEATHYTRLKVTIGYLFEVYQLHGEKPAFSGQIHQLYLLKKKLVETGIADD